MKKVLITGSSGYIGQHLAKMLHGKYEVIGLDRCLRKVPFKAKYGDLWDANKDVKEEFDTVIHLAGSVSVGESIEFPYSYYRNNIEGTDLALESIIYKNFIFASTGAAEYPESSPYAMSKRCAEDVVKEYCERYEFNYTTFRFYNVFGCDSGLELTNEDGLLSALRKAKETGIFNLYGADYRTPDGSAIRDYVYVNDICRAIEKAIEKPANGIEELGSGENYSVKSIVNLYRANNNCDFNVVVKPRRKGDVERSYCRKHSTYFKQTVTMSDMLKENK
jgi:UDP-glucose 4-epimerase